MMPTLRLLWRAPLLLLLTAFAACVIALSRPWRRLVPETQRRVRNWAFRSWGRGFIQIVGLRLRVEGAAPAGRFLLVTNHVGYVDIVLLGALVEAAFVAKADLRGWPGLGASFAVADTIFIDRSRRRDVVTVTDAMERALSGGLGIVFFPEGTSGRGDRILRFRPSLFELAASRNLPVHWAVLSYRSPAGWPPPHRAICWWGDMPFLPHFVQLLRMPCFEATVRFGEEPLCDRDRKRLAERLHARASDAFEPMT